MAKQMVWNNQGYFEYLDKNELYEPQPLYETKSNNKSHNTSPKQKKQKHVKTAQRKIGGYVWKDQFGFDDELYERAKELQRKEGPRKCPYCPRCFKDINAHIKKIHKDKPEVQSFSPNVLKQLFPNKKTSKEPHKITLTEFSNWLKNCSKSKIKKLLYLRWNATKTDISFLEYVGKHNILFTGNFDENDVEVKMLYNYYTSRHNHSKNQKKKSSKSKQSRFNSKYELHDNSDDVYHYPIGGSFDSRVYGKTKSYLNKGDHNFREEGKFGSSVLSDDYDN